MKKRFVSVVLLAVMIAASLVSVPLYAEGKPLPGDVNGDGKVNIADVMAIRDVIFDLSDNAEIIARADVNEDGSVTVADILAVVDIIFNPKPLSISFTQHEGRETCNCWFVGQVYKDEYFILRTHDILITFTKLLPDPEAALVPKLEKYHEDFFEEKALMLIAYQAKKAPGPVLTDVAVLDDTMYLTIEAGDEEIPRTRNHLILIEINQADIDGVTKVVRK